MWLTWSLLLLPGLRDAEFFCFSVEMKKALVDKFELVFKFVNLVCDPLYMLQSLRLVEASVSLAVDKESEGYVAMKYSKQATSTDKGEECVL